MTDDSRFIAALQRLDILHGEDPRRAEDDDGQVQPYELLYARRMSEWLGRVAPEASEALQLAVRAQHLQRWRLPRDAYSLDRSGYLAWRRELGERQAELAAEALAEVGYAPAECERVARLVRKQDLKGDAEAQALEDTACLVFLQHYFEAFSAEHRDDDAKLLRILRKTWRKMSPHGHELAATLTLSDDARSLVQRALA